MKRTVLLFAAVLCLGACSHKAEEGADAASSEEAAAPGDIPDGDSTASADAAAAVAAAMAASPTATDMPSASATSGTASSSQPGVPPATQPSAHTEH